MNVRVQHPRIGLAASEGKGGREGGRQKEKEPSYRMSGHKIVDKERAYGDSRVITRLEAKSALR